MNIEVHRGEIQRLRQATKGLLTPKYDTDFNLLRWCQGYSFDIPKVVYMLFRHLRFRRFYNLDEIENIPEEKITKEYFPLGIVGLTGKENHFLVIESAGRIDLEGLINSVQMTNFLLQRLKFQEKVLSLLNEQEMLTGIQSGVVYILDLDGLQLNRSLLNILTHQYRTLWEIIYTNYPEWISHFIIINAPSFTPILWKTFSGFIPDRTRTKVNIFSAKSQWVDELLKHCDPKYLPVHWGGEMVDKNGDPMCRDRLKIPFEKIPKELYWVPDKETPHWNELDMIVLGPGSSIVKKFKLIHLEKTFFVLNLYVERLYTVAMYYTKNFDQKDLNKMEDWYPEQTCPGMPTVDFIKVVTPGPGLFCLKFGNENAWFRSLSIYYRLRFVNKKNQSVPFSML